MPIFNKNIYQPINAAQEDCQPTEIEVAAHYLEKLGVFDYVKNFSRHIRLIFASNAEAKTFKKLLGSRNLITIESTGHTVDMVYAQWDQLAEFWNEHKSEDMPELSMAKDLQINLCSSLRCHRHCCVIL